MTNPFCLRTFWLKKGWDLLAHTTKMSSYIKSGNNTVDKQSRSTHYMASPTLNTHTHGIIHFSQQPQEVGFHSLASFYR